MSSDTTHLSNVFSSNEVPSRSLQNNNSQSVAGPAAAATPGCFLEMQIHASRSLGVGPGTRAVGPAGGSDAYLGLRGTYRSHWALRFLAK